MHVNPMHSFLFTLLRICYVFISTENKQTVVVFSVATHDEDESARILYLLC